MDGSVVFCGDGVFEVWTPGLELCKAQTPQGRAKGDLGGERGYFEGIVSIQSPDIQKEVVVQDGIDWRYFLKAGFFNYDHQDNKGVHELVGEPQGIYRTQVNGVEATGVKGYLYLSQKRARDVWEFAESIKRAGGKRRLGLSVQGDVLSQTGKTIRRCRVKHVAISYQPIHLSSTFTPVEKLKKSLAAAGHNTPSSGGGGFGPLHVQSIARRRRRLRGEDVEGFPDFLSVEQMSFPAGFLGD